MTEFRRPRLAHRGRLVLMIFAIAGTNIGYTAILPFLPQIQRQLQLSPALLTTFLLAYPAAKIASQALVGGPVTDRHGAAVAAAIAWVTGAAGMALIALSGNPAMAVAGRFVWGAGTGIGIPAIYRAASLISEHYDVPLARLRAAVGAGAVLTLALGPVIAGVAQLFAGFRVVLAIGAAISLLGAIPAAYAMSVPVVPPRLSIPAWDGTDSGTAGDGADGGTAGDGADGGTAGDGGPASALPGAGTGWLLPLALFASFEMVLNLLFAASEPLVPLYVARQSEHPAGRAALILAAGLGVWMVVTLASGRGPGWLRKPAAGTVSLILLAGSCLGLAGLASLPVGLAAIAVFMLAQGHGYLVARTGIDVYTDSSGTTWGRFNAVGDIGFLAGPLLAVTAHTYARGAAFALLGAGTFAAAGGYALLCAVLRRRRVSEETGSLPEAMSSVSQV